MKVLIGTLYSGENEFQQCCDSINSQTFQNFEHLVIEGLSASEAHQKLFHHFMDHADKFDLLLKVDADMVLARPTMLQELVDIFTTQPNVHQYQIAVQDWYTDRLIFGMNTYRNTVRWHFDDSIFVENSKLVSLRINNQDIDFRPDGRVHDKTVLAPAAFHSPDPSDYQAFHFGLHKGVKVVESIDNDWEQRVTEHCGNIEMSFDHYLKSNDRRLLLAVAGGEVAVQRLLPTSFASYKDPQAVTLGAEFCSMNDKELLNAVHKLHSSRNRTRRSLSEYCKLRQMGRSRYAYSHLKQRAHCILFTLWRLTPFKRGLSDKSHA